MGKKGRHGGAIKSTETSNSSSMTTAAMGESYQKNGKDGERAVPLDRGTLAQCLNATSQIAAECNSILRDLLRGRSPQHQDLQRLAGQVLMGQTVNLQELQKKMESQQATLAELLRVLRPKQSASGGGSEMSLPPGSLPGPNGPYSMMESSLSVLKGWDAPREQVGAARSKRRAGKNFGKSQHQMTKWERYKGVESFWKSLKEKQRVSFLSVPVKKVLHVAKSLEETGALAGSEQAVMEALAILKRNNSQHACFWRCPCCAIRAYDAHGFLDHLATHHETVQYACEDTPLLCTTCAQEIVGAFYYAGEVSEPTAIRCIRCAWESSPPAAPTKIPQGWALHVPREFIIPSDSLGIMDDSDAEFSSESEYESSQGDDEEGPLCSSEEEDIEEICTCHHNHQEIDALESRIRNSEDGLLAAIAFRIDSLAADGDVAQFEAAVTCVVQQTQRMMHGALTSLVSAGESGDKVAIEGGNSAERVEAVEHLQNEEDYPDQAMEVKKALELLNPSELQDLLALMARKYSSQGHQKHRYASRISGMNGSYSSDASSKCSSGSIDSHYEPMCVSVLKIDSNGSQDPIIEEPGDDDEYDSDELPDVHEDELVCVHGWWVEHLIRKNTKIYQNAESQDAEFSLYLLQWIFGNVAHGNTNEFLERQRMACGGKSIERTIMDAYAEIAETWRHLAATMDRKRHISTLREAVAEDLKAVSDFDSDMIKVLTKLSEDFHQHVMNDPILNAVASKEAPMDGKWSQKALQSLQVFHELKDEASIRYAQALIDREIAVLELADVMDQHECDVAERELQTVDAALAAARQDLADAETEYMRAQAEGPALHRKRDILDRVNKEAEYRERLQELQQHITACKERIVSEEAYGSAAQRKRESAVQDLSEGRIELQEYLEKRQRLDRACHAVLQAQERDKGQELTDAFVDARIKAVWQVVAGVADAIRSLYPRYAPGSNSTETLRHSRCTALAKTLSLELDDRVRVWWEDISKLRRRAADLACVDMGTILENAFLEVIRQMLEEKAADAREAATLDLLEELEREEQAKKAAETKKAKKKAGKAKKANKAEEAAKQAAAAAAVASSSDVADDSSKSTEKEGKVEELTPEQLMELEYEKALEMRRKELEKQEADLLKLAQEASMTDDAAEEDHERSNGKEGDGFQTLRPKGPTPKHSSMPAVPPPPPPPPPPRPPPPPPGKPTDHLTIRTSEEEIEMRIITYFGDWNCYCGKVNRLWDTCACGQIPPCRDWVRGRCTYKDRCRFGHPPFELPDSLPRPKSPIAKPGIDAIVYKTARNPEASAAATAKHMSHGQQPTMDYHAAPPPPPAPRAPPSAPAKQVSSGPPPPLKPAPWASVNPTAQQPVAASPVYSQPTSPSEQQTIPPPPPPPKPMQQKAPEEHMGNFSVPEQQAPSPMGGFDLFGSNPLVDALEGNAGVKDDQMMSAAFAGLQIGAPQTAPPPPGFFVEQNAFLDMPTTEAPEQYAYQSAGMGGIDTPAFQPATNVGLSMGPGPHYPGGAMMNPEAAAFGMQQQPNTMQEQGDDWGDLQLQLPSDLGEILGTDTYPERPQRMQESQTTGFSTGAPTWGAPF